MDVDDAAALARDFLQHHHPNAVAAVLGGSAGAGAATPTSDLDLVVLYDRPTVNYFDTLDFRGRLFEAFAYDHPSIEFWLQKELDERRPVLHSMWADGILLLDDGSGARMAERARRVLAEGPAPLSAFELDHRRYRLSSGLDDLRDRPEQSAEQFVIMAELFAVAAETVILMNGGWLGHGKWLVRRLRDVDEPLGAELVAWAEGPRDAASLIVVVERVLDAVGGYLQAGFRRGERPPELG